MPATPLLVPSKPVAPAPFGLLESVAVESLPTHGGLAGVQYDTEFCGVARPWTAPCVDPGATEKTPDDGIDQTVGVPIPLYHLFTCRLVGGEVGDAEARARRSLDLGASRALEEGFGTSIGAAATTVTTGAVGVIEGLALLEQYGGENYGGRRVIHVSLDVLTVMFSQFLVKQVGDHLETNLGSLVIAGPGYKGTHAPADSHWMYATGAVRVWEGATITTPLTIDDPATGSYMNEFSALVERIYVPTYECFAAAAQVTLEA